MLSSNEKVRRFIEKEFPVNDVNFLSVREASYKTVVQIPKIHNIHTWFARRPAGAARVLTLAALLPENIDTEYFKLLSGITEAYKSKKKVIYMVHPKRDAIAEFARKQLGKEPKEIVVVDPMAGGGSIPLEALRMGFRTIAVEYNPVAYLILKATPGVPGEVRGCRSLRGNSEGSCSAHSKSTK